MGITTNYKPITMNYKRANDNGQMGRVGKDTY